MKEKIKQLEDLDFRVRKQESSLKQLKKSQIKLRHEVQREFMRLEGILTALEVITPREID